jgi:hypothetical protein
LKIQGTFFFAEHRQSCQHERRSFIMTNEHEQNTGEYELTAQEKSVIGKHFSEKLDQTTPRMRVVRGGKDMLPDHPNKLIGYALLMESLGTTDFDFVQGLIEQLGIASLRGDQIDEGSLNFMLSVIKGIRPRDQVESLLASQMACVHMAMMRYTWLLGGAETIQEQDHNERTLNKLARTFTGQIETLKRYRSGVEQKFLVQQVSISKGGQAIVGNVTQAPRETAPNKTDASPPTLTDARIAPMPIIDKQERDALPRDQKDDSST